MSYIARELIRRAWHSILKQERVTQQRAGVWSVLTATLLLHGCALLCPERADPETVYAELKPFSALARRAAIDERDPANAVVIPESAYLEATRGRTPQSSDEIAQTRARQLNALGNDPTALGMLAPARHSSAGLQFSGSVFIVVRNPTFVAFGRGVEITDYYVAVQELSGRSAWVGSGARVLLGAPPGSSSAACCGPSIMCGSPGPLRGPCGGDASCVADGIGIGGLDHPALAARISLGLPMIGIQFQGGRFTDVPEQCATVVNPSCAISVPVCGPADNGYVQNGDGSADVPVGSSACGDHTRSASFPGIPPVCLIALTTGEGPYCGGLSGDDRLPLPEAVDGLPPGCRLERSVEGSNVCSPSSERKALKELEQLALRAMFAGGIGSRCEAQSTGFSICTTCTAAGCSQTARRDVQLIAGPASGFEPVLFCPDGSQPPGEVVPCTEGSTGGGSSGSKPPDSTPPPPSGGTNPPPGQPPPQPTTTSNGDPPPPPIDNPPPPPVPEHEPKFRDFTGKPPSSMDPVSVGDGAFAIDVADLNFDGPVRPLSFRRHYHSQRDERSSLGSNWAHNWDATVTPVSVANARAWMLPFCAGAQSRPSCLVLRQGDGSSELFYLDYGTMLYLPQAGSTTTLATTDRGGWAARSPWGDVLAFDSEGALIEDRDRFGNGFHIVNEPTPMGAAFAALCSASALAARHETPASRRCAVLSFLVGRAARPLPGDAWQISMTDFASLLAALPAADGDTNGRILYGVQQLLALAALGPALEPPDGGRATRVRRVVDDLGRELRFDYQRAVADAEGNLRFNVPGVELLTRVRGPEGTLLTFTYGRPELYPAESAESFLVGLRRHDSPVDGRLVAAPDRQIAYEYLWPGTAAAADVALYAGRVYDAYLAYYRTFVGCAGKLSNNCGNEFLMPGIAPGNAEVAARIQRNQYLGRVADNIMTVSADGQIESETRYALDPWQARFDRVYAQRYGSSSAVTPTWPIAADRPEDHWQSTLPKATREYASAGPRPGGGDETVAFLPAELRSRYPLDSGDNDETVPPPLPRQVVSPLHPARELSTALIPVCQGELSQPLFEALPGVRNKVEYYPPPDVSPPIEASGRLPAGSLRVRRTRLSCDQLAIHQLGDPGHNDLVSSLEPDLSTPTNLGDQFATRISGRRAVVAADSNRICEWTREVDRNGDVSLFGLNYRGQPLVEAHLQRSNLRWAYFERLYNADGLMVEERRPTEGAAAWTASAGYTAYTFDEIDSSAHQGWDGWLPAYWARRGNLLRTETRSASGAVRDLEPSGDAVVETIGRYSTVQYEPLFNQQWRTQSGAVAMAGTAAVDRPEKWSEVEFDYQEAGHLDTRFDGLLDELRPWGYSWFRNTEGTGYDYPRIAQWQLPLPLLGRDVNGDGVIGFGYVAGGRVNGKAAAVRVVHYVPGESELLPTLFTWAPHGLPAQVVGPDGATTLFRYYPAGGATTDPSRLYGDGTTPAPERAAATYAGLLAEVKVTRFGLVEDANLGPAQAPCEALRGPYQWLLPASCGDPRIELRALGVPESVVAGILQGTAASADRWRTTVLSYTDLGRSHTVTRDGRSSRQQRDTDGRVTLQRDPLNNSTLTTYSVKGLPEYVVMRDTVGALMTEMRLRYDEEGRVRRHCTALLVGGCPVDGNGEPMSEAVSQSFYFPEGELALSIDPEGLASRFERDENGRAVTVLRGADGSPDPARSTRLGYTLDGQLASAFFGTETTVVAAESLFYDGLQRLREHIDSRGSHWYFGHSSRDLMVRRKIDTADFGQAGADPRWNTQWRYDLFGRLVAKFENGIEVHSLDLDRNGRPLRERELGRGTRFLRYDLEGRLLWTRDASGDEEIRTFRPVQGERTSSTLQRCCGSARTVATSTTELLDGLGRVVESVDSGAIDQRRRSFVRDGRGSILNATDAAGLVTLYEPNLVGWVQARKQQRNLSIPAVFDDTVFKYDRMGRTVKVTDAANEASEYAFNAYGELVGEKLPGLVPALRAYAYDALGRLSSWTRAGVQITRHYDNRGDPIQDVLEGSSAQMISKRTFDDLGRLSDATEANPGVTELPASRRTVFNTWRYDSLGRLARESVRIGEGPERSMTYDWSLELGSWRLRTTGSPGSTLQWQSSYDVSGRLTSRRRIDSPGHDFAAEFEWLGTSLVNQASRDAGQVSALRQHRDLDNFGAPLRWTYSGIDVDANGTPLSQAEGDAYCGSVWTVARCGAPLFVAETIRDVAGREVSIQQHWGLPLSAGTPAPNAARGFEWLGVAYGGLGAPATVWEHRGAGGVGTDSLPNHRVTAADVRRVAATAAAVQWDYARREAVGDLLSISQPGQGLERWSHPGNYNPGHELAQVRLAGQARAVTHDTDRRIVSFGDLQLGYDPRGNLATAYRSGQLIEAYLHDARGRLVQSLRSLDGMDRDEFLVDGDQIAAAFDATGALRWSATWGAEIDQLLEWSDASGVRVQPVIDTRHTVTGVWNAATKKLQGSIRYTPEGRAAVSDSDERLICEEAGLGQICALPVDLPFALFSAWRSNKTGMSYLRNRWYSPELAQFTAPDPQGYGDSFNLYAFAGFDSINGRDPYGLQAAPNLTEPLPGPQPTPLRLVPNLPGYEPAAPGPALLRAAFAAPVSRLTLAAGLLIPSNLFQTYVDCTDGICTNSDTGTSFDEVTRQELRREEVASRSSIPIASKQRPGYDPSALSGPNYKDRLVSPDSDPDICGYCGKLAPGTIEHIIARVEAFDLGADKALTKAEAKKIVDALNNLIKVCKSCNSRKSGRPLGTTYEPPNPDSYVKQLLAYARNPALRWILRELGLADESEMAGAVLPVGKSDRSAPPLGSPTGSASASCTAKDLSCH